MNKKHLLARYDKDLRIHVIHPEARKEVSSDVVRFVRHAPGMNFVEFTFATEANLDRVIRQQVDYFAPMSQPFTWNVYQHDLLPSLQDRLTAHGFVNEGGADVMVLGLKQAPTRVFELTSMDIRPLTNQPDLKDAVHVLEKVYGSNFDWIYERLGLALRIPGYLSMYAAYVQDEPVSVAWTFFHKGQFATLHGGSTVKEFRGRGLYSALVSTRLKEIRERGYPFALVEAGPESQSILAARFDFCHLTRVSDYKWKGN